MVSVIQNQKVERRKEAMAEGMDSRFSARSEKDAPRSVQTFRTEADEEIRRLSQNLDSLSRSTNFQRKKAPKHKRSFFHFSRRKESGSVQDLLKEWEDDNLRRSVSVPKAREGIAVARQALGHQSRHGLLDRAQQKLGRPIAASNTRDSRAPLNQKDRPRFDIGYDVRSGIRIADIPVLIAALFALGLIISTWYVPATIVTGIFASRSLVLPAPLDSDGALVDFSQPMSESDSAPNIEKIDSSKFDMLSLSDYQVQPGDTLSSIAARFNLNIDSIISFNNLSDPRHIHVGETYKIPNRDGLQYKVANGDSLETIAKKFGVSVTSLLDGNGLDNESVASGTKIFIPDARLNSTDLKMLLGELFLWPAVGGLSSGYGYRRDPFSGVRMFHNGQDIAAYIGAPVRAALAGKVVDIENQIGNYGKMIIIQHPRGFKTLYGHLDSFNVVVGQYVSQGQIIARMGNTGKSTGPHLHFSVIQNGTFVNPLRFLK